MPPPIAITLNQQGQKKSVASDPAPPRPGNPPDCVRNPNCVARQPSWDLLARTPLVERRRTAFRPDQWRTIKHTPTTKSRGHLRRNRCRLGAHGILRVGGKHPNSLSFSNTANPTPVVGRRKSDSGQLQSFGGGCRGGAGRDGLRRSRSAVSPRWGSSPLQGCELAASRRRAPAGRAPCRFAAASQKLRVVGLVRCSGHAPAKSFRRWSPVVCVCVSVAVARADPRTDPGTRSPKRLHRTDPAQADNEFPP